MLTIGGIDKYDVANPVRHHEASVTVFFSGCNIRCKDCHNPSLWDKLYGSRVNPYEFSRSIMNLCNKAGVKTVLLMGGEPLDQNLTDLRAFMHELVENKYEVWVFTGYEMKSIPEFVLSMASTIKTGRYEKSKHQDGFPASTNQRLLRKDIITTEWVQI